MEIFSKLKNRIEEMVEEKKNSNWSELKKEKNGRIRKVVAN
jgi:hypothetical protein